MLTHERRIVRRRRGPYQLSFVGFCFSLGSELFFPRGISLDCRALRVDTFARIRLFSADRTDFDPRRNKNRFWFLFAHQMLFVAGDWLGSTAAAIRLAGVRDRLRKTVPEATNSVVTLLAERLFTSVLIA